MVPPPTITTNLPDGCGINCEGVKGRALFLEWDSGVCTARMGHKRCLGTENSVNAALGGWGVRLSVTCASPGLLTGRRWRLEPCGRVQTLELDYVSQTLTTSVIDSLSLDFIYKRE